MTHHIHVIGVGNRIRIDELGSIAGQMGEVQLYSDFGELEKNFVMKMTDEICPCKFRLIGRTLSHLVNLNHV